MTSHKEHRRRRRDRAGLPAPARPTCDPDELDKLECKAAGIAEQAEYLEGKKKAMDDARTQFDSARKDYSAARETAAATVGTPSGPDQKATG